MRAWSLVALLLIAPLAGCAADRPAPSPDASGGDQAPAQDWQFVDTEGTTHSTASVAGSPTVLFFFATWCSSCRAMTDDLAAIHDAYADDGVDLLSLSWDTTESDSDFEAWKDRYGQPWPHGKDPNNAIAREYGVRSQSSVVVLGADGTVLQAWGYGQASEARIAAVLDEALTAG